MARSTGYALLAALAALVALVSIAILVVVGRGDTSARVTPAGQSSPSGAWVGTWETAAVGGEPGTAKGYPGTSIRNVVHASVGGTAARVRLANTFGTRPLVISHATVAVAASAGSPVAKADSMRALTFAGGAEAVIPAGGSVVSDAAQLAVPDSADLLVTTYSPTASGPVTYHRDARQISYTARGEHTAQTSGAAFVGQNLYWRYVTGVDVFTRRADGAVVVLGDSITNGVASTVGANRRWTDDLAMRMLNSGLRMGVLNAGLSGNRILLDESNGFDPGGLNRLSRDALGATGARTLVVQLGINDILRAPRQTEPAFVIDGLRAIVHHAHAQGLRVVGATLAPVQGHAGYSAAVEAVRQKINQKIRSGVIFDDVVDFDKVLRDPRRPARLLGRYDSGDHLNPNNAGYQAMADAVQLGTLKSDGKANA